MLADSAGERIVKLYAVDLAGLYTVYDILNTVSGIIEVVTLVGNEYGTVDGRVTEVKHRLAPNVNEGPLGTVGGGNAKIEGAVILAYSCGIVHNELTVVVDDLGSPEIHISPMLCCIEADLGLAPIHKVCAFPNVKALDKAGSVAIINSLVKNYLGVADISHICDYHFFDLLKKSIFFFINCITVVYNCQPPTMKIVCIFASLSIALY
jgi:hypothetical protein